MFGPLFASVDMFAVATIELGSRQWVWPAVVLGGLGLLIVFVSYRTSGLKGPLGTFLAPLKLCGIALLALCLVNPTWVRERMRPGENLVVLLVDNSASMQVIEQGTTSRGQAWQGVLEEDRDEWLTRLMQDFDLRRYTFDERLNQVEDFQTLTFNGRSSQLTEALDTLRQRFLNQPLATVLLISDGNVSNPERLEQLDFPVPIYPLLTSGEHERQFDLSIQQLSVTESPFEDAPITVSAVLSSTAAVETTVLATLARVVEDSAAQSEHSAADRPIAGGPSFEETRRVLIPAGESAGVRFQLKPEQFGIDFYRLRIVPESEPEVFEKPATSTEATLLNNERLVVVDRGSKRHRVLYFGGRPNWEFKFLNRALAADRDVDLVSLIRMANKEAKFDFRGRAGENTNPFFRGQDRDVDEETAAYDQAVIIRLNTRDAQELSDGFPKTRKALYEYDAVILDGIEARFFSPDQQTLLDRFVSERGGGLMMLGGRDSFRHGDWNKTPLRDALPVYLDRGQETPEGSLRWNLTREGWLEPWIRLRPTETEEQQRLSRMPPLRILNPSRVVKPGARVFAELNDETGKTFPAIVTQQYGQGRAVAVLVGDLWRWALQRQEDDSDDVGRTWRQLIRWLVTDVSQRVEVEQAWTDLNGLPAVRVIVRVRDAEHQPQENAEVRVTIQIPGGESLTLDAEPSLAELGLFEVTFVPRAAGGYRAEVGVLDDAGIPLPTRQLGWVWQPDFEEFREVTVNRELLEGLARQTDGEVVLVDDLPEFVRSLPQRELPVTELTTTPLWHSPLILLLALLCFATEWGLRRWRGLP